jgi:DNA-binding MarR family transcriptional regulator
MTSSVPAGAELNGALFSDVGRSAAAARKAADYVLRVRKAAKSCFGPPPPTDAAWNVLLALYTGHSGRKGSHIAAIASRAEIPRTTALRAIMKLQESGYVSLSPDPRDKRAMRVRMTDRGIDAMRRCFVAARFVS